MLSDLQFRLLKISGTVTCRYGFFGSPDLSIWVPGADMWCTKPGAATAHPGTFHAGAILESAPFSNMRRVKLSTFMQRNFSFGCQWSEAGYMHLHKPSRVGKSPHPVNTSRGESILNSKCVYEGMRQIESYQMHQVSKCSVDRFIPTYTYRSFSIFDTSTAPHLGVHRSTNYNSTREIRTWIRMQVIQIEIIMPWISQTDSPQNKGTKSIQRVVQRFKMWKEKFPTCIRISNKLSPSYHMQSVGLQLKSSSRKPPMIIIMHNLLNSTEFAHSWRNTICKAMALCKATGKAGPPRHRCHASQAARSKVKGNFIIDLFDDRSIANWNHPSSSSQPCY